MPRIQPNQIKVGSGPQHRIPKYGAGPAYEQEASRLSDNGTAIDVPGRNVTIGDLAAQVNNGTGAVFEDLSKLVSIAANGKSATSNARLDMECEDAGQAALSAVDGGVLARLWLRPEVSTITLGFSPTDEGALNFTGAIVNLNAANVNKNGVPLGTAASVSQLAQTASIENTPIPIDGGTPPPGLYRLSYYLVTIVAGTSGTVKATFGWTDPADMRTVDSATITFGTLAAPASGTLVLRSSGAAAIHYQTTVADAVGDPEYALYITLERLQ